MFHVADPTERLLPVLFRFRHEPLDARIDLASQLGYFLRHPLETAESTTFLCNCVRGHHAKDLAVVAARGPPLPPDLKCRLAGVVLHFFGANAAGFYREGYDSRVVAPPPEAGSASRAAQPASLHTPTMCLVERERIVVVLA